MIWRVLYNVGAKTFACEYTSEMTANYNAKDIQRYANIENLRIDGPFYTNRPAIQGPIELNPKPTKLQWEKHVNGFYVLRVSPGNGAVVLSIGDEWRIKLKKAGQNSEQGGFKTLDEAKEFVQLTFGFDPRPTIWDRLDKDSV